MTEARTPRIVSLVPSITETLLAWGVSPVAVTRFCEVPGYPTVGGTKNPDLAAIEALKPDVVLMDREENRRPDAEALEAAGMTVTATHVRSLDDVGPALALIAAAAGLPGTRGPAGATAPSGTGGPAGPTSAPARGQPRAFVPIWRRPWMTISGSTYGSSILAAAGFVNVYASAADPYPETDLDEARRRGPDVVLAPSEPYPFTERHRAELERVAPTVMVDGRDLFWWGSRTPAALERLAALPVGR